jgi:hypothetical protein
VESWKKWQVNGEQVALDGTDLSFLLVQPYRKGNPESQVTIEFNTEKGMEFLDALISQLPQLKKNLKVAREEFYEREEEEARKEAEFIDRLEIKELAFVGSREEIEPVAEELRGRLVLIHEEVECIDFSGITTNHGRNIACDPNDFRLGQRIWMSGRVGKDTWTELDDLEMISDDDADELRKGHDVSEAERLEAIRILDESRKGGNQ